jgi:hypothetical protein
MKTTRALVLISLFAIAIICSAPAIKLCQLDWLSAWQSASGTLSDATVVVTSSYGSRAEAGTWAVSSYQGSPGIKHIVSGVSQCTDNEGDTSTGWNVWPSKTLADNKNCWCRMTSPNIGGSWVFLFAYSSSAGCAAGCADDCAYCIQNGAVDSCSRSAVLALP